MKTIATFGLLLCLSIATFSQNRNSIWCFGDSAGIDFRNVSMPVPITTGFDTRGTCASVSDSLGNLLFYSNTRANGYPRKAGLAYNRNHTVMLNGDSLHGNGGYNEMLIIPKPQSSNLNYLFTLNIFFYPGLYYSIIDMDGDSGSGMVSTKNILVNEDSVCSAMTAVKHGNGRDWWLIVKGYSANQDSSFYEYLITADTIIHKRINIGSNSNTNGGTLCFTKDGNKLAFVSFAGLIETFDFNRCTGEFSNTKLVRPQCNPNCAGYFGAAYSASGNVLYVTATGQAAGQDSYLLQCNLLAPDIWASRETLWTASSTRVTAGNLKLGPDDKVYLTCCWISFGVSTYPYQDTVYHTENMNLSVIEDPDVVGAGCNLNLFSFYLGGKRTYWGLPNNPDYEMGAMFNSACDSLTNSVHFIEDAVEDLLAYPNPLYSNLFLKARSPGEIFLYDQFGKLVFRKVSSGGSEELDLNFLGSGIYTLQFESRNGRQTKQIVKIIGG